MRLDRLAAPEPNHAESKHAQPKRAQPDHAQPAGAEQLTLENGLSGRNGHAVLVDREHNVWVATDTGLDRFRRRNLSWKADPSMRDDVGLVTGGNGEVWQLSRAAPLIKRAIDAMPVRNGPSGFWMGFPDPDGSVWLSKGNEFLHWRDDRFTSVRARAVTVASCATATA